jgi:ankyrin repeat protein
VTAKDIGGRTPLHYAALAGDPAPLQLLLDKGADVMAFDNDGRTPQDFATAASRLQIKAMIEAEALRRVQRLAFAMGQQTRLGAGSAVQELEEGVVRMVLELV